MVALYRKWRPQVWEDLVGQEHISTTLIHAIDHSKLSHAYMFCGSRGTGKTTTARILAKALNCENRKDGSPCNECGSCHEISSGSSLDVIEIDAASHRGIGEIKTLIEQVRFASVSGKYKVYIIDEFHMLTNEAFNALLKTLEEPPPKVIFVLATTEGNKILPTIVSRCQRFDFHRISVTILLNRLKYVSQKENIDISEESLLAIARKSNGGLRDALSLLDQISSFSLGDGKIPEDVVNQVLGLVSINFLVSLIEAIAEKNHIHIIETLNKLSKEGNDPTVIITETVNFFRNLLIVKSASSSAEFLEVPMSNIDIYKKCAELFSADEMIEKLESLNEISEKIKKTQTAQLWLEINFVVLCKKKSSVSVDHTPKIEQKTEQNNISAVSDSSEIKYLMNKIRELETNLNNIKLNNNNSSNHHNLTNNQNTQRSHSIDRIEPITDISNLSNELTKSSFSEHDLKGIWERLLMEVKKKSIPTHAILCHGFLIDIDQKRHNITIIFESDGYIELLKTKKDRVEQVLSVMFGVNYGLILEKGKKEYTKSVAKTSHETVNVKENIQTENLDTITNKENVLNFPTNNEAKVVPEKLIEPEIKPEVKIIEENTNDKPQNIESEKVISATEKDEELIEINDIGAVQENTVKDVLSNYTLEHTDLDLEKELEIKEKKDKYFLEVADIFKGKIIKILKDE
ncbi:MAG: DNA polymerase III subunit gamma/tau [Cyanobacteriota bacterium]